MTPVDQHTWQQFAASFLSRSIPIPAHAIEGTRILITGAGGSIGAALAHAIAAYHPAQLLLLDSSEQALYEIDRALAAPHHTILASVCDETALEDVFLRHCPQTVFHAAAFKHAPLMERHPFAALENNTVGTFTLMQTAISHRAAQVILVSTDKAADPVNIMGASKRIAELLTLAIASPATKAKAVRLGNVYASQGSVVPLFQEQIAQGKPVTVTHPDATRYFVTIEQSAALLLLALSDEFPNSILVPDLTSPAKIEDIAKALIAQSNSQSQIVYTGLRPGDRLHEQLLSADESFITHDTSPLRAVHSPSITAAEAVAAIEDLQTSIRNRDLNRLLGIIARLVPAYSPSQSVLASQPRSECRS
jgi:FlaA1/EpsC-like NDP-sugar epimerase